MKKHYKNVIDHNLTQGNAGWSPPPPHSDKFKTSPPHKISYRAKTCKDFINGKAYEVLDQLNLDSGVYYLLMGERKSDFYIKEDKTMPLSDLRVSKIDDILRYED